MLIDGTKRKQENTMIGGQPSAMMRGSGSTNMGQTGSKGGTSSGGFTNLNKYLSANQGANNQTINKLNTTAQNTIKEADTAIGGARNVGTSAQQNLDRIQDDQQFVQSALDDPTKADVNRFQTLRTNFDANPTAQISEFDTATSQANALRGQKANQLQGYTTSGGLTDYLRSQRTTPRYSQGSQSLDKFLIKGTDEGAKSLENIGKEAQRLQQEPTEFADIRSGLQSRAQALNPNLMNASQVQQASNQAFDQYIGNTDPASAYTAKDSDSRYGDVMRSWNPERQNQALYGKQSIERQQERTSNLTKALEKYKSLSPELSLNTVEGLKEIINLVNPSALPNTDDKQILRNRILSLNIEGLAPQAQAELGNLQSQYGGLVNDYNQMQNQQWTGADLLGQEQLARVNALAKLSGQDPSEYLNRVYARPNQNIGNAVGQMYYGSDGSAYQGK